MFDSQYNGFDKILENEKISKYYTAEQKNEVTKNS